MRSLCFCHILQTIIDKEESAAIIQMEGKLKSLKGAIDLIGDSKQSMSIFYPCTNQQCELLLNEKVLMSKSQNIQKQYNHHLKKCVNC